MHTAHFDTDPVLTPARKCILCQARCWQQRALRCINGHALRLEFQCDTRGLHICSEARAARRLSLPGATRREHMTVRKHVRQHGASVVERHEVRPEVVRVEAPARSRENMSCGK